MDKKVGRFRLRMNPSPGQYYCNIVQTHANGSSEEIAEFIQMSPDNLRDLRYLVETAMREVDES